MKWSLKDEDTALSADLKTFEETYRVVELVRSGLLAQRKYSYTWASPDAIVTVLI